ncbi:MAG: Omp28-related outer membrane protein [Candidatus Cryptobacteroides sp.]
MNSKYITLFLGIFLAILGFSSCSLTGEEFGPAEEAGDGESGNAELALSLEPDIITADGVSSTRLVVVYGVQEVTDINSVGVYQVDKDGKNVPVTLPDLRFSTSTPGSYTFWVTYKSKISNKVTVVAISPSLEIPGLPEDPQPLNLSFRKRVFITQFTGTGCGYCPGMIKLLRSFKEQESYQGKTVIAACHTYNNTDPMYLADHYTIANNVFGYPSVMLDLNNSTMMNTVDISVFNKAVNSRLAVAPVAGICATSVAEGSQFIVKAGVKTAVEGKYYIAAWLLEDGIEAKQSNYGFSGDFSVHDNAVRDILGFNQEKRKYIGFEHDAYAGEILTEEFKFTLDEEWKLVNTHVVVYVCVQEGTLYTVNNVIDVRPNETIEFEYSE